MEEVINPFNFKTAVIFVGDERGDAAELGSINESMKSFLNELKQILADYCRVVSSIPESPLVIPVPLCRTRNASTSTLALTSRRTPASAPPARKKN